MTANRIVGWCVFWFLVGVMLVWAFLAPVPAYSGIGATVAAGKPEAPPVALHSIERERLVDIFRELIYHAVLERLGYDDGSSDWSQEWIGNLLPPTTQTELDVFEPTDPEPSPGGYWTGTFVSIC